MTLTTIKARDVDVGDRVVCDDLVVRTVTARDDRTSWIGTRYVVLTVAGPGGPDDVQDLLVKRNDWVEIEEPVDPAERVDTIGMT